jgi:hypothetical protein
MWERKSEKASSVSSSKVRLLFPLHQRPESCLTWHPILGVNLLNSQSVAIKFVRDVCLLLLRSHFTAF